MARRGIERIERLELKDRAGIELIGIATQPVEPGGGNINQPLRRQRAGPRARIGGCRIGAIDQPGKPQRLTFLMPPDKFTQHRLDPQYKARWHHWRAGIAPRPAEHHIGRAQRSGKIMRGKADAKIRAGHAQRAQHWRGQQGIGRGVGRPDALGQPAADDQVRPRHARLEQAVDRDARVPAPWRTHRDAQHGVMQHGMQLARVQPAAAHRAPHRAGLG